ncbi:MAG: spore coat protein U domain-containing protein [Tateyamaria sp.]|nr:spore coat protein U domain-containing protein [Tateyamaria sp.]
MSIKLNQSYIKFTVVSAILAGSTAISTASYANNEMLVKTSVGEACLVEIDSTMLFGAYDPIDTHSEDDLTKEQLITLTCTDGSLAKIELDVGNNPDDAANTAAPARNMLYNDGDSDYLLTYNLYVGSQEVAAVWGAGVGAKEYNGTGGEQTLTVYGRVNAGQAGAVSGAVYSDTVTVSYTF